jgi:hypothetical protein
MKKQLIRITAILFMVSAPSLLSLAQPNPGQNSDNSNVGGGPIGGNAPIGSGIVLLLGLGAAWGAGKAYAGKNKQEV